MEGKFYFPQMGSLQGKGRENVSFLGEKVVVLTFLYPPGGMRLSTLQIGFIAYCGYKTAYFLWVT